VASPAVLHEQRAPKLLRELNVWHATSVVAGTIIGSGIFLVPAEMMQAVGSAGLVYLAWILGGLLSFFGALTYAELAAVRPWAGGEYVENGCANSAYQSGSLVASLQNSGTNLLIC